MNNACDHCEDAAKGVLRHIEGREYFGMTCVCGLLWWMMSGDTVVRCNASKLDCWYDPKTGMSTRPRGLNLELLDLTPNKKDNLEEGDNRHKRFMRLFREYSRQRGR